MDGNLEARGRVGAGPEAAVDRLAGARLAFRAGGLDTARSLASAVGEGDSEYPEACLLVGNIDLARGDLAAAERAYREALRVAPGHPGAWNNLGNLHALRGAAGEARSALEKALALSPDHLDARLNLAALAAREGDQERVDALIAEVLERDPANLLAHEARTALLLSGGQWEAAEEALRRLIELRPAEAAPHVLLGRLLRDMGRFAPALEQLELALSLEPPPGGCGPGGPGAAGEVGGSLREALGDCLLRLGRADEALRYLEEAIQEAPLSAALHSSYAVGAAFLGDVATARSALARALELDPGYFPASLNLSRLALASGDPEGAVVVARAATRAAPRDRHARRYLVGLLFQLGRLHEARGAAEAALETLADDGELWNLLGAVQHASGALDEARASFRRSVELPQASESPFLNLARIQLEAGDLAGAVQCLARAIERFPGSARAHYLLGEAQRRRGKHGAAREAFEEATRIEPQNLHAWDALARSWSEEGDPGRLIAVYRAARLANPERDFASFEHLQSIDLDP